MLLPAQKIRLAQENKQVLLTDADAQVSLTLSLGYPKPGELPVMLTDIPLSKISDFPQHPFKVRMDESMTEMVESVRQYGVLVPALVRPKEDGGYEMVAGHRRKAATELAGPDKLPCIARDPTDDEAIIIIVDSNLQRE